VIREWLFELWHYREVFFFMVWRNVKVRYKQTMLGASWAIIQPFVTMVVFTVFFGKFAKIPSDGIPYPIFSYSALLPWTYFSRTLGQAGNSLVSNKHLITKIYFPRVTLPASYSLSGLLDFALASIILLGMMLYYDIRFTWGLLMFPVLVVILFLLVLGVGMIFSSLNVKYRDIGHSLPFIVQLWLFLTPIIYPTSMVPEKFRSLMAFNPTVGIIEAFRAALLPTRQIDWNLLGLATLITIIIFAVGLVYFTKTEREFADIV
jgi:homopolymeric O-antigen transport system permease protein